MRCQNCRTQLYESPAPTCWKCGSERASSRPSDATACSPSSGEQEPEQEACGTTHYAGCACHERGWENKWRAAIELAARAILERDELAEALREMMYGHTDKAERMAVSALKYLENAKMEAPNA